MLQLSNKNAGWEVIEREAVYEHPCLTVSMEAIRSPNGEVISDWPKVYSGDFVNAVVLNEQNDVMILEGYKHGLEMSTWQVLGSYLEQDEDPGTAVKQQLLNLTGYESNDWVYLGSFVADANRHGGVGHFFCARGATLVQEAADSPNQDVQVRWVSLKELKYALLDGRISGASYALNVALTLRMF
jgi:ADP-ribose pyrophosphatase